MKIAAIDFNIQKGHINFNRKILSILSKDNDTTFISSKSYIDKIGYIKSIKVDDNFFSYSTKYEFVIKQILLIRHIYRKYINNYHYDRIIILGFENISFSIAWRHISIPTFAFIHNNLTKGRLSIFMFKKIEKNVAHIFLEEYILKEFSSFVSNKLYYIPHPINPNIRNLYTDNKNKESIIFCPSASSSKKEIIDFAKFIMSQNEFTFYAKGDFYFHGENKVYIKPYFNNYEALMQSSRFIFLPFKYDFRVSGIFYDSMKIGKQIISSNSSGKFIFEMHKKYPNSILLLNNWNSLYSLEKEYQKRENEHKLFINKHSDNNLSDILTNILK